MPTEVKRATHSWSRGPRPKLKNIYIPRSTIIPVISIDGSPINRIVGIFEKRLPIITTDLLEQSFWVVLTHIYIIGILVFCLSHCPASIFLCHRLPQHGIVDIAYRNLQCILVRLGTINMIFIAYHVISYWGTRYEVWYDTWHTWPSYHTICQHTIIPYPSYHLKTR